MSIGSIGVNVKDAGYSPIVFSAQKSEATRRQRERDQYGNGGHQGRRCQQNTFHGWARYGLACERSAAALSVRSQVNSGSVRPKCPNAAVFL